MTHRLRSQCGAIRGYVALPAKTVRAICYCRDCQAFARYLARAGDVLDEHGGTDIVATAPSHVRFEQGLDALACMSLSATGILGWYASCCRTPFGNTPSDRKTHYVGLVHNCLAEQPLNASFVQRGFASIRSQPGVASALPGQHSPRNPQAHRLDRSCRADAAIRRQSLF
jgi:hypothetical protein